MRRREVEAPRRMRRRLMMAFVLTAGLAAGALATGSFVLVRQARLGDSVTAAERTAKVDLTLAAGAGALAPAARQQFVSSYQQRDPEVHAVLVVAGRRFDSSPSTRLPIPPELARLVARGELSYQRLTAVGVPFLVLGGPTPDFRAQLYFFRSEAQLHRELNQLALILALGWLVVVGVAALVGRTVARRTLEPVARASEAARSLAEGLLATRIPERRDDEFGTWAASFNEMAQALEDKISALSEARDRERRFTADVAHELKTPLAALVGEASLLRDQLDAMPPEARRPAELMVSDVSRLRRLVEDLMEISRFDAGQERVRLEPVDLRALAEAIVHGRGWEGAVLVTGSGGVVRSDRRRLERIVANLAGNALQHGGGRAEIRLSTSEGGAVVEVEDRGPGIPADLLPRLFDRFSMGDPSRSGPHSGLGLAIVMENARLLGATIDVRSEPGRGTAFVMTLPAKAKAKTNANANADADPDATGDAGGVAERLPAGGRDVSGRGQSEAQSTTTEGGNRS
jgi:two-component system sensor histidine kinase MtrB